MKKNMKMYIKKILLYFLGAIMLFLSVFTWLHWTDMKNFPHIISSYYAKEFCSCFFVVQNPEAYCHKYVKQYVPISSFSLDQKQKKVTVSGLGQTHSAVFVDRKNGCVLTK